MATRDVEHISKDQYPLILPQSILPSFPDEKSILAAVPELVPGRFPIDKTHFLAWVDFALENPDEVWEPDSHDEDKKTYHYIAFLDAEARPPALVVEAGWDDDSMEVADYSLVISDSDLHAIRSGNLIYCRRTEWDRERLVRRLNEQALSRYDENHLEEARELIDAAIRLSGSGSAYLFNNRGLISWKLGKTDEAKQDFLASINLDHENGDPYFNIGLIYFDEADYSRALYYLRRAVEMSPLDSQFLTELGHLYLELEREEEALILFRKAVESDPSDAQVDFHLGYYFLYKKHKPRHALKYYNQGLKKAPDDQFALADIAVAYLILGNRRKSVQIHRVLAGNSRLMPYTISRLVYLNMEMGDYENALTYYRRALTCEEPFEPEWLHYNAALAYAKTGHDKQALDILDLAVKAGGEAVIRRARSEKALAGLKRLPDFKRLIKMPAKRRNR